MAAELLLAQVAQAAVHRHPNDPCAELRSAVEGVQSLEDLEQGILGQVARFLRAAEHAHTDGVDPGLIAPQQRRHGRRVAMTPRIEELQLSALTG
jgi:hypothetical protein